MIRFALESAQFGKLYAASIRQAEAQERQAVALGVIGAALEKINTTLVALNPPEDQRVPGRAAWTLGPPQEE